MPPKPTDEDFANYNYNIESSPFYDAPDTFLKVGQKVRAKHRIWDAPWIDEYWGWLSAEKGEIGVVIYVEPGNWPTVKFPGGFITCVTDFEVDIVKE